MSGSSGPQPSAVSLGQVMELSRLPGRVFTAVHRQLVREVCDHVAGPLGMTGVQLMQQRRPSKKGGGLSPYERRSWAVYLCWSIVKVDRVMLAEFLGFAPNRLNLFYKEARYLLKPDVAEGVPDDIRMLMQWYAQALAFGVDDPPTAAERRALPPWMRPSGGSMLRGPMPDGTIHTIEGLYGAIFDAAMVDVPTLDAEAFWADPSLWSYQVLLLALCLTLPGTSYLRLAEIFEIHQPRVSEYAGAAEELLRTDPKARELALSLMRLFWLDVPARYLKG